MPRYFNFADVQNYFQNEGNYLNSKYYFPKVENHQRSDIKPKKTKNGFD